MTKQIKDNFDYVKINLDEYELDNIVELNDIKTDKTNYYKISAFDKENDFNNLKLTIDIDTDIIILHIIYYNELKCKAIEGILSNLIKKRKLLLNYLGSPYLYFTSIIILVILGGLIKDPLVIIKLNIYFFITSGFIIALAILSYYIRFNLKNIIILRRQRYGFYRRNKDKIIVGVIVAIIASLMTALISYFITTK